MNRAVLVLFLLGAAAPGQEVLYNGIRLPAEWPPRDVALTTDPLPTPPYLLEPPAVIPIDVGRQLLVDDFLIAETTLRRTFHRPEYYAGNPVLRADRRWEFSDGVGKAMPFSDGVFYDSRDRLFKMWYTSVDATLYATSRDGVHWDKPALDVRAGTNVVMSGRRDSSTVWLDADEPDASRRYKMLLTGGHMRPIPLYVSADGIHWGEPVGKSIPWSDRTTFFKNPFRNVWVFSLRDHDWVPGQPANEEYMGRLRRYWESRSFEAGAGWPKDAPLWVMADRLDHRRVDLNVQPQLYNLDATPYESLLVGLFSIWRGQPPEGEKPNEITVGFSRDGFHWYRPDRRPFLPLSERYGDWNHRNVQSAGGVCLVVGDKLYFYVSGRSGVAGIRASGHTTTGLATLRRDGFVSMDAGAEGGVLTTRPVKFSGRRLFVNADAAAGELSVEVLEGNRVVEPFSAANCAPLREDNTMAGIRWRGAADLAALAGKAVRFRFRMRHSRLYSFWVSQEASGASGGYVAAGGPGLPGTRDTVGAKAYQSCCRAVTW